MDFLFRNTHLTPPIYKVILSSVHLPLEIHIPTLFSPFRSHRPSLKSLPSTKRAHVQRLREHISMSTLEEIVSRRTGRVIVFVALPERSQIKCCSSNDSADYQNGRCCHSFCDGGERRESLSRVLCAIAGNELEAPPPQRR